MSGQREQSSLGRGFEEEKDDFHLSPQRNCRECVPQVMETGMVQKCILAVYYKQTHKKFQNIPAGLKKGTGTGSGHLPHPAIPGSPGNQDNLRGLEITGQVDSTELQWSQTPAQPLTGKNTLPIFDYIDWKQQFSFSLRNP